MNNLTLNKSQVQYMSSKEIAEFTEKEHKQVLRNIRDMIENLAGVYDHPIDYKEFFRDNGQLSEILLDKELTYTLVSGYSFVIRNRIVKRWIELENENIRKILEEYGNTCKRLINQRDYDLYVVDFGEVRKVGISTNVEERVKHLELEGGRKALKVSTFSNIGGINAETRILNHFDNDRIIGEYLSTPMKDILLFITLTFG